MKKPSTLRPCPPAGCRAVIYTRVSTARQAQTGHSLDVQDQECTTWCEAHAHTVTAVLSDPGRSASSMKKRPGLRAALHLLASGDAEALVVKSRSRLTRSLRDWLDLVALSQEQGWNIVILDENLDLSTPNGRLVANLLASTAQWERETTAQRTADTFRVIGDIRTGPSVSAYTPEQAEQVLALRGEGHSLGNIAKATGLAKHHVQRIVERGSSAKFVSKKALREQALRDAGLL